METAPFFLSFPTLPQLVRLLGAFLFFICPVIADLSEFPSLPSSVLTVIRLPRPMGLNFVHWSHWGRFKKTKNTYCCLGLSSSLHIYTHTPPGDFLLQSRLRTVALGCSPLCYLASLNSPLQFTSSSCPCLPLDQSAQLSWIYLNL